MLQALVQPKPPGQTHLSRRQFPAKEAAAAGQRNDSKGSMPARMQRGPSPPPPQLESSDGKPLYPSLAAQNASDSVNVTGGLRFGGKPSFLQDEEY